MNSSTRERIRGFVVLALVATASTVARAGDRVVVPPTADERAWARRVATTLDLPEGALSTIQRAIDPKAPSPFGVGVRLQFEGLSLERVRFPSLELAQAYEAAQPPEKAVDRRQRETLRVEGVAPESVRAREARRAGWLKIGGAAQSLAAERGSTPPRVVVVAIDQKTIAGLGPFGGQYRAHHARLIAALDACGARGIGFDLFFPENPSAKAERGTQLLAQAAAKSQAPVVVSTNMELDASGQTLMEPNASALQGVRTGAVLCRTELVVDGQGGRTGEQVIAAESGGLKAMIFVLGEAAGVLSASDLERLGVVEEVTVGAELVGGQARAVTAPAIRPNVRVARPSNVVSYLDVLERRVEPSAIRDALVIVGVDDGSHDVVDSPNPDAPHVGRLAGVHLHAAALQRALVAQHRGRPVRRGATEAEDDAEIAALAAAEEQRYVRGGEQDDDVLSKSPAPTSAPRRK